MSYASVINEFGIEIKSNEAKPASLIKQEKKDLKMKSSKEAIDYVLKDDELEEDVYLSKDNEQIRLFMKSVIAVEYDMPDIFGKTMLKYNEIYLKLKSEASKDILYRKCKELLDRIKNQIKMCTEDL